LGNLSVADDARYLTTALVDIAGILGEPPAVLANEQRRVPQS
jgi:hypothetical protein